MEISRHCRYCQTRANQTRGKLLKGMQIGNHIHMLAVSLFPSGKRCCMRIFLRYPKVALPGGGSQCTEIKWIKIYSPA